MELLSFSGSGVECGRRRWYSSNTEEEQSINVEFHDTATQHTLHVNNTLNHTEADLSSEALLLACEADSERARFFALFLFISDSLH